MKVLLDTCVIVDALQKREPFCNAAMEIFLACSRGDMQGAVTAKSLTDIYYLVRKSLHDEQAARGVINKLYMLFEVQDTFAEDCQKALKSLMNDYEDAVMAETAKRIEADYIVTRNLKDYLLSEVKVLSQQELLEKLKMEKSD